MLGYNGPAETPTQCVDMSGCENYNGGGVCSCTIPTPIPGGAGTIAGVAIAISVAGLVVSSLVGFLSTLYIVGYISDKRIKHTTQT